MPDADEFSPASAFYWLPILQGHPTLAPCIPLTECVREPYAQLLSFIDGGGSPDLIARVQAAAAKVGYPVFIRTDQASAKHDGPTAYRADADGDVARCLSITVDDNCANDLEPQGILVRRFLALDAAFTAFKEHPVAREWRVFASPGRVHCSHPYWPEEAIRFHGLAGESEPVDWREKLRRLYEDPPPDAQLNSLAVLAATLLKRAPAWSVDFARDAKGAWWLIDCAPAVRSTHPESCPNHQALRGKA